MTESGLGRLRTSFGKEIEWIGKGGGREYGFYALSGATENFLSGSKPFVVLVHAGLKGFDDKQWFLMARHLLSHGARYIVCAGLAAQKLEDIFDRVIVEDKWESRRREGIVTTSHKGESLREIAWYLVNLTWPDKSEPKYSLILFQKDDQVCKEFRRLLKKELRELMRGIGTGYRGDLTTRM